jgi:hypothetical protein
MFTQVIEFKEETRAECLRVNRDVSARYFHSISFLADRKSVRPTLHGALREVLELGEEVHTTILSQVANPRQGCWQKTQTRASRSSIWAHDQLEQTYKQTFVVDCNRRCFY